MLETFIQLSFYESILHFMQTLTEVIIAAGWRGRVLSETQLARLLDGSAQRRYNLVNRALRRGELVRLRRGRYRLAAAVGGTAPHPFVVAQALRAGSYVSFESALSFHGLIREAVPATLSVVPGRRRDEMSVPGQGSFLFWPLALNPGYFLEGVGRVVFDGQAALVARPLRALLDRCCLLRSDWPGVEALLQGLRIDPDGLAALWDDELEALRPVYRHRRMCAVIDAMQEAWAV
ncbi:hypothetical protein Thimo_1020 [Thioflavicoccus mobilis 8321]|uniref:Transcriptional regulator n=2 Tax=Thioflavicoccus mobilis TaxID=80679 RepID=L0GV16_9GAMM|nr:hypothetical protein Thimo_1020 [Thioflavicoccus mobilis 8321]